MATQPTAAGARAILVVDNCPPDLHQRLAELCRRDDSNLSLLTVEYDIREDKPEGTDIFKLETSSPELIQQLVDLRFPNVSAIDARTIAELSGGNARIALATAETIGHQESLAGLTDEQVFQRLFVQRHAHDDALYLSAQACSLVYSFQGEDISDDGELARLGRTIGRTPREIYRSVAELHRRAISCSSAATGGRAPTRDREPSCGSGAPEHPQAVIQAQLMQGASERLLRSFSRRLGYLHASNEAVAIVRRWVGPEGLLSDVANLNEFGQALFENIAPSSQWDVLQHWSGR